MSDPAPIPLLDIQNVSRIFASGDSEIRALDDVSITVWSGEFIAIMGQSGSGKSTLMNIIGCLDRMSSGSYHVLGQDVSTMDADRLAQLRRETFGFVFQRYNLLATESAISNVEIPAIYAGADSNVRFARAKELLTRLGLDNRIDHRPPQLSGGQQQRVAIARALMNNPPLILADEPTGALDSKSGADVMALLHELHSEGRTIVLITHDEKVASNAERIIHIMDGKISGETIVREARPVETDAPAHKGTISFAGSAREALHMALKSLRVNIFRTSLTLLGIIIGVAAVVTMLAVGNGSKQKVLNQISAMGTNLLMVLPGAPGIRPTGDVATLTIEEADLIKIMPNVEAAVPVRTSRMTVRYKDIDVQTVIQGVGQDFLIAKDWRITKGQFFSDKDVRSYAPVVVLGKTVESNLFPDGAHSGQGTAPVARAAAAAAGECGCLAQTLAGAMGHPLEPGHGQHQDLRREAPQRQCGKHHGRCPGFPQARWQRGVFRDRQCHPDPGGAVLPADGLGSLCRPATGAHSPAPARRHGQFHG